MATLNIQEYGEAGNDLTMAGASAGGDQFANSGAEELVIHNGSGSSVNVTVTAQNTSFDDEVWGESTKGDQVLTVTAGSTAIIGPFPRRAYNDGSGNVQISYSATTSVEIAAIKHS